MAYNAARGNAHIVALTGLSGAGKSFFREKCFSGEKYSIIKLGEYLRKIEGVTSNQTVYDLELLAEKYHTTSIGTLFIDEIEASLSQEKIIVVDSIRSMADYNFFKSMDENMLLLYFNASQECRFRRLQRGRNADPNDFPSFMHHEKWEMNFGLDELMSYADYLISSDMEIPPYSKSHLGGTI